MISTKSKGIKGHDVWCFVKYGKRNINTEIKGKSMSLNSSQKLKLGEDFLVLAFSIFFKGKKKKKTRHMSGISAICHLMINDAFFYWLSIDMFVDILLRGILIFEIKSSKLKL